VSITYVGGLRLKNRIKSGQVLSLPPASPASLRLERPSLLGTRADWTVAVGDSVMAGQLLASAEDGRIAPLHAPLSGQITAVEDGFVTLENDHLDRYHPDCTPFALPLSEADDDTLLDHLHACGVTADDASLSLASRIRAERGRVHTLLLCALDDQPEGGLSTLLCEQMTEQVMAGLLLLLRLYGARRAVIVTDERGDTAERFHPLLPSGEMISLRPIRAIYPVSHPRHLILTLFSKEQKAGMELCDTGYAVYSPDAALAVYNAFVVGLPMIERTVLLAGDCLPRPALIRTPIGTEPAALLSGHGLTVKQGGVMHEGSGLLTARPLGKEERVGKDTRQLLLISPARRYGDFLHRMNTPPEVDSCIGCDDCRTVCPAEIDLPAVLSLIEAGKRERSAEHGISFCIGCGLCSYVCPARIDLRGVIAELNRLSVTPMPLSDREQTEPTSPAADSSADSSAESPEDHALPPTPDADDTEERSRAASHPRPRRDLPVEGEKKGEAHDEE